MAWGGRGHRMTMLNAAGAATAALAAAVLIAGADRAGAPREPRPNVVVILADDARFDSLDRMPNVLRLIASRGVTFTNAFVTTSECCPSRASILCGQYAHHTGVIQNFGPSSYPHFYEQSNLAVWLHDGGYETALIGKYLNDYTAYGNHHVPPGWSDWIAVDSVPAQRYYDYTLNENGRLVHYGTGASDYSTDVLARKAVDFIRSAHAPFFLYFAPIAPHLPALASPRDVSAPVKLPARRPNFGERDISDKPWRALYKRPYSKKAIAYLDRAIEGRQLRSLVDLDRQVGVLMRALRDKAVLDNTVVVYMSDNGFMWGEHRLGGKIWPYEESTNVPLVVRTPWAHGGTVNHDPVLNIDFASTISQLAGVTPGAPQDGDSLVPLLEGSKIRWRQDYLIEYLGKNKINDGGPPPYVAIHTPRYLYVQYRYRHWQELYDLQRDPWELDNVVAKPAYAGVRADLARQLHLLYTAPPHPPRELEAQPRR